MVLSSDSVEEYLEGIYFFNELEERAKNTELAKRLKVAPPSVTQMVKKLADWGYVQYVPYKGAVLTGKGMALAQRVVRKHRLLERFFYDYLGMDKGKVHDEACRMEHSLSDEAALALCDALDNPETCPDDGNPIPRCPLSTSDCNECAVIREGSEARLITELSHLQTGEKGVVSLVDEDDLLKGLGISKGDEVEVMEAEPFKGPMAVKVSGETSSVERVIAAKIYVEVIDGEVDQVEAHPHGPHHLQRGRDARAV
jgi:DtxR family Mn-dependent transcriptional regulator